MAQNEDVERLENSGQNEKANGVTASAAAQAPVDYEARPDVFSSTVQEILFVSVATMAISMSSLLNGAITVLTSQVQDELNMTTAELTWLAGSSSYVAPWRVFCLSSADCCLQAGFWLVPAVLRPIGRPLWSENALHR